MYGWLFNQVSSSALNQLYFSIIIIIIICLGDTCHRDALYKIEYKLKSASHVSLTNQPHPFLQGAFHLTRLHSHARKRKHGCSLTVMPWTILIVINNRRIYLLSVPSSGTMDKSNTCCELFLENYFIWTRFRTSLCMRTIVSKNLLTYLLGVIWWHRGYRKVPGSKPTQD